MAHEKRGNTAIGVGLKAGKKQKKKNFKAFQDSFKKATSGFGLNKKKKK
jgi:hypothetical protein